jgi:hypothetical protein
MGNSSREDETVGTTLMEHLTRWQMLLAGDRLGNSGDPIYAIAQSLGYESEGARANHLEVIKW